MNRGSSVLLMLSLISSGTASSPRQDGKPVNFVCSDNLVGQSKHLLLDLGVHVELAAEVTLFILRQGVCTVLLFLEKLVAELLLVSSAGRVTVECIGLWQVFRIF